MFTFFAQAWGVFFVLALLYTMVAECRACGSSEERKTVPPQKINFSFRGEMFNRFVSDAARLWFIER